MQADRLQAFIRLHIAVILFGFTGILGRLISLDGYTIVVWRIGITLLSLLLIPGIIRKFKAIPAPDRKRLMGIGILIAIHWATFFAAIKYSNVSVALSVLASTSFFTAITEPLILRRKLKATDLILGLLVIIGFGFIFKFVGFYLTGIVLGLISAALAATFGTFNKLFVNRYDAFAITLTEFIAGLGFLLVSYPLYLYFFPETVFMPQPMDWLWLFILAIVCTTGGFVLTLYALKVLSPFATSLAINLEPIYAIILAWLIFREDQELNSGFYIGAAIIVLAVFIHPLLNRLNK